MPPNAPKRAVVLLSGGLDSATCLTLAAAEGREVYALSFRYGQLHEAEIACAREQATNRGAAHEIVDLSHLGRLLAPASSLIAASPLPVPAASSAGVPSTYVPARNTLFLSYALAWAEALGACEIWLGVNALDYSGYPDCRPEFVLAFQQVVAHGTRDGAIVIRTPLLHLRKSEIVGLAIREGVDLARTLSCYNPVRGRACGACDSCSIRATGFRDAGVPDPALAPEVAAC
jgi:7-cyano-7-deazaguanine synthase